VRVTLRLLAANASPKMVRIVMEHACRVRRVVSCTVTSPTRAWMVSGAALARLLLVGVTMRSGG